VDEDEVGKEIRGRSVPTTVEQSTVAVMTVLSALTGGDRQMIAYMLHMTCASLATDWLSGDTNTRAPSSQSDKSEEALKVSRERMTEVGTVWERIDFACSGLSPAQLVFLSGRVLYEAARRYGPKEATDE